MVSPSEEMHQGIITSSVGVNILFFHVTEGSQGVPSGKKIIKKIHIQIVILSNYFSVDKLKYYWLI